MRKKTINSPLEKFSRMMFSKVIERLAVILSENPLGFSQVAALHIIDTERTISIQDLSFRLNLSLSATSRLVNDLVQQDLLIRSEYERNRRTKLITLTSRGENFLDQLSLERVKIIKEITKELPKTNTNSLLTVFKSKKG